MARENLIVIGSGPAGMTAGIYAARAGLQPVILEGLEAGGQLLQTRHVANYPGFPDVVAGATIVSGIRRQAETAGARFVTDEVRAVDFSGPVKKLSTLMGDLLEAKSVIIATGAGVAKTGLPGEAAYWGRGISACLTCDGAFYAGKDVLIVGTGPAAPGARNYLEKLGVRVAAILPPEDVASFDGDARTLKGVTKRDGTSIAAAGVFLVTARRPQTAFLKGAVELDERDHVVTTRTRTSVPGVFAAGDCAEPRHKQAVIAAGDGARAALEAQDYLAHAAFDA
ncbi:MAG: NAD(P)/FAD-dependent oxidoreductase [Kiritimatiellia bacterium]